MILSMSIFSSSMAVVRLTRSSSAAEARERGYQPILLQTITSIYMFRFVTADAWIVLGLVINAFTSYRGKACIIFGFCSWP
jgi:hypothetical protein